MRKIFACVANGVIAQLRFASPPREARRHETICTNDSPMEPPYLSSICSRAFAKVRARLLIAKESSAESTVSPAKPGKLALLSSSSSTSRRPVILSTAQPHGSSPPAWISWQPISGFARRRPIHSFGRIWRPSSETTASRHSLYAACTRSSALTPRPGGRLALGYPVTLVADAHTSAGNAALTPQQVIQHHNATLTNISSFGPRVSAVSSEELAIAFPAS